MNSLNNISAGKAAAFKPLEQMPNTSEPYGLKPDDLTQNPVDRVDISNPRLLAEKGDDSDMPNTSEPYGAGNPAKQV